MDRTVHLEIVAPGDLAKFRLPKGVKARLNELLDRRESGVRLTSAERREAKGLVALAEMLSLLKSKSTSATVR